MILHWLRRISGEMPLIYFSADTGVSDAGSQTNTGNDTSKTDVTTGDEEDPFDKERAMVLIRKLREQVKNQPDLELKLAEATAKLQEHDLAGQSELERLTNKLAQAEKRAADAEAALEAATEQHKARVVALYVENEAIQQGIDPKAASKLVETQGVELDEEDALLRPKNIKKLLEETVKVYPYLAGSLTTGRQKTTIPASGTNNTQETNNNSQLTDKDKERAQERAAAQFRNNF